MTETIDENSGSLISHQIQMAAGSTASKLGSHISTFMETTAHYRALMTVLDTFNEWSVDTGGHVQLLQEFSFCPVLMGSDSLPVFLYEFIEIIDETVDYDRIREELPTITSAQIDGAISFIRRLTQFNMKNVDIDGLIDQELTQSNNLLIGLTEGLGDQENNLVLNLEECDR